MAESVPLAPSAPAEVPSRRTPVLTVLAFSRHPLLIPVAVAAFTAWFGPALTREWQNHDRELALKDEFVQQATATSASLVSAVQRHEFRPSAASRTAYVAAFGSWDERSQALGARLSVYLEDEKIRIGWRTFTDRILDFYNLADTTAFGPVRLQLLEGLSSYARLTAENRSTLLSKRPGLAYQRAWRNLKYGLLERRDELQRLILTARVRL